MRWRISQVNLYTLALITAVLGLLSFGFTVWHGAPPVFLFGSLLLDAVLHLTLTGGFYLLVVFGIGMAFYRVVRQHRSRLLLAAALFIALPLAYQGLLRWHAEMWNARLHSELVAFAGEVAAGVAEVESEQEEDALRQIAVVGMDSLRLEWDQSFPAHLWVRLKDGNQVHVYLSSSSLYRFQFGH